MKWFHECFCRGKFCKFPCIFFKLLFNPMMRSQISILFLLLSFDWKKIENVVFYLIVKYVHIFTGHRFFLNSSFDKFLNFFLIVLLQCGRFGFVTKKIKTVDL